MPLRLHPVQGAPIEVTGDRILIGRDRTSEVRLRESSVSRKHATIERRGTEWVITDGGSANGTFVDDLQVAEAVLHDAQVLRVGSVVFRIDIEEEREPPPSPTQTLRPEDLEAKTEPALPAFRAAPAPAHAGMSRAQAAELLGLGEDAPAADVRRQYHKLHNDLHVRMSNTPSPSLKRMYQKNLQELRTASELLAPGSSS